ncbi:hypothetical protein ACFPH6_26175 [Streptomyces xiangluensis]|uniref:Uncharacterized protein n=1 Tax=Streptomyces xiangluensis TaxID=2665720 RepID=A0ABV8YVD7_9ACTN
MRLGKALATGVAEERPWVEEEQEELQLAEQIEELEPAAEEVPVAR